MNSDMNTFISRLAEIGVIDTKLRISLTEALAKPCKDSRFPALLDGLFGEVEKWHETASRIRYTSDPALAETVADGVRLIYKFVKSNIGSHHIKISEVNDYNTKLAKLDAVIRGIEQKLALTEQTGLDIRKITLDMLEVYKNAINQQLSAILEDDIHSKAVLTEALGKFEILTSLVSTVVDTFSRECARNQKDMFESINAWETTFAYGNYDKNALSHLEKAIISAKAWSLAPLALKAKHAKEGDYYTADIIGTRTMALATTMDAIGKITQAISLIERAKVSHERITDTTRLEAQKEENDKEIERIRARIEEIKSLAAARKIDLKTALSEKENLEKKILPVLQKNSERLNTQILSSVQRRNNLRITIFQIENVCRNFLAYKDDPRIINLFAEYVNFEALTNFLSGSKLDSNINDIVNLAAIEKITLRKFDEANEAFSTTLDEQLEELDPVILDEEQEEKTDLSEEEMLRMIMGEDAPKTHSDLELDLSDLGEINTTITGDEN